VKNYWHIILDFLSKYICEVALLVCIFLSYQYSIRDKQWERIISADGLGYYSYLPATFIYKDYTFSFTKNIEDKYEKIRFGFLKETSHGNVNKYFVGLSLLWLPFFLLAHFLSFLLGFSADGYSQIYQLCMLFAANFYLWVGCKFTLKLISEYSLSQRTTAFIILLIVFATNLSFYAVVDPTMSHVYSFAVISAFLYATHSFFKNRKAHQLYWMSFLLGIIFLIRPTNIVVALLVPFFATNFIFLKETIKFFRAKLPLSCIILLSTIFLQFFMYYLQTGYFIAWSYGEERFYFEDPQFFNILLSYQKGMFIYTPVLLLSLGGLFHLFSKNKFQFIIISLFLLGSTYIIASWWCWWYGGCLGQRAFVDYYAVAALLFAFLYLSLKGKYTKWIFFLISLPLFSYSLILIYQYKHGIIHHEGLSKQKFWFSFLKTDEKYEGIVYLDSLFTPEETNIVTIKASNNKFLSSDKGGVNYIVANRDKPFAWETFNMIILKNDRIAFKTDNGSYVSAWLSEKGVLKHGVREINDWEKFELIPLGKDSVALKASNNKFVALEGEKLVANSDNIDPASIFLLLKK